MRVFEQKSSVRIEIAYRFGGGEAEVCPAAKQQGFSNSQTEEGLLIDAEESAISSSRRRCMTPCESAIAD